MCACMMAQIRLLRCVRRPVSFRYVPMATSLTLVFCCGGISGAWELTDNYVYFLDRGLLDAMVDLIDGGDVLEFGAGKGCYTAAFRRKGVSVRAFDGSPQVASLTHGLVQSSDLTSPLRLGRADWVVCLEVAEHIPRELSLIHI